MAYNGMKFLIYNKGSLGRIMYWKINHIRQKSSYYITTPIFYVNAEPHIGHLYTSILADATARFQVMKNPKVNLKFMTGTDEHGSKISISAQAHKMSEQIFCDAISQKYINMFDLFNLCYTDFLRTTEERHKNTATRLWNLIFERGYIYQGEYAGWYCISDEAFVSEKDLCPKESDDDGVRLTLDTNKMVHFVEEKNYKFKLSHFKNDLLHWLRSGCIVKPTKFQNELELMIENEEVMRDLSVSRPAARVKWGIPVPNDPTQVMYVWLDALSSYLTSSGYPESVDHWPPDLHVIGKDILRFHGVYWPSFLIAAGLEPPRRILCHSHWLNDGMKMSKSLGNVIDPMSRVQTYTCDGLRYYLLHAGVPHSDGNFREAEIRDVINADLADKLGNLLRRCLSKVLNTGYVFPSFSSEHHSKYCSEYCEDLIQCLETLPESVAGHYENFEFCKGITEIMRAISLANKFIETKEPWKLKNRSQRDEVRSTIHIALETLRICGILLQPVVPKIADSLLKVLSVDAEHRSFEDIRPFSWQSDSGDDRRLSNYDGILFRKVMN
ncbi:UNVERIFIED_CONTAM: hypothetical protein PYX00_004184 [Menopon gallinae]|uniref:Methionine--tRNA ligase, mitochondrial n=1 Tax=Menopon gallinae TaxID=328185 RepID=A0AAW2I3Z7_9NEOP